MKIIDRLLKTKWLRWIGTIITMSLFIWLMAQQNWALMWISLRRVPIWIFPSAFLLYFSGILANAGRWYLLLRTHHPQVSFGKVFQILLSGNYVSNFLPSTIGGDTVRIVSTSQKTGWAISMASVVVDRLLNMFTMFLLLPFAWMMFRESQQLMAWWAAPALTSLASYQALTLPALSIEKIRASIKKGFWKIRIAFGVWRNQRIVLFTALLISLIARLSVFLGILLLSWGLGIQVTLIQVIGVGAITYFFTLLPISINGFGLREMTMSTLYVQLGASWEQASALVVLTRFILLVETLPGALWVSDMLVSAETQAS
jgi:uncharacterized membrane protein YbhN (UPF0104 family)